MSKGFFESLAKFTQSAKLNIIVSSNANGEMTVNVVPHPNVKDDEKKDLPKFLTNGFAFTGKPQDLDATLLDALAETGEGYADVADTLAQIREEQKKAKEEIQAGAKKAAEAAKPASKAVGKPTSKAASAAKEAVAKPTPVEEGAGNGVGSDDDLFGQA